MGYAVKPSSYRTCICGKVCKGGPALANHARTCRADAVHIALIEYCHETGKNMPSRQFITEHLEMLAERLTRHGYLK